MPGAVFDLGGADRVISSLATTALIGTFNLGQVSDGTVALGANRLTLFDFGDTTFTGNITGTGGLTKAFFVSGTSTFTQPLAYTGSTRIRGTMQLAGAATLAAPRSKSRGGTLQFTNIDDNAAAGGYIANRIGASVPVTLAGGGITFTENANTPGNHQLGAVTLAGGGTLTRATRAITAPSTVTIANLIRNASRRHADGQRDESRPRAIAPRQCAHLRHADRRRALPLRL